MKHGMLQALNLFLFAVALAFAVPAVPSNRELPDPHHVGPWTAGVLFGASRLCAMASGKDRWWMVVVQTLLFLGFAFVLLMRVQIH